MAGHPVLVRIWFLKIFISILFGCTTGHVAWAGMEPESGMEPHQSSRVPWPGMETEPLALGVLTTGLPGRSQELIFRVERSSLSPISTPKETKAAQWVSKEEDLRMCEQRERGSNIHLPHRVAPTYRPTDSHAVFPAVCYLPKIDLEGAEEMLLTLNKLFVCLFFGLYSLYIFFFNLFIFYWRIISLQNFVVFCQISS